MDDWDRLVVFGWLLICVLSVVAAVHAVSPDAALWCGVVGTTGAMVWEASQCSE